MDDFEREVRLSAVHVHWSEAEAAFLARSDQYPGLVHRDEFSSLAAVDGLIDLVCETFTAQRLVA